MTFLDRYVRPSKIWASGIAGGLAFGTVFLGMYFLSEKPARESVSGNLESKNMEALETVLMEYNTYSGKGGIKVDNPKKSMATVINSWKSLPQEERYDTLKFMIEEGYREPLYNLRDDTEDNFGGLSLWLLGR